MSRKIAPWRLPPDLATFGRDMDRFIEDTFGRGGRPPRIVPPVWRWSPKWIREWAGVPMVDVYEEGDSVVVKAEVPGMEKDEIELILTPDTLTIKGERKKVETVEDQDYHYSERAYGAFARTVELPAEVAEDKVTASLKNGVLEVRLPKAQGAKKEIKVKVT